MGMSSMSERENKEIKELKQKMQIDQYLSKFPDSDKYLGLENVSALSLVTAIDSGL